MELLQREIERHRRDLGLRDASRTWPALQEARERQWVNSHLPIGWPVMPPGLGEKILAYAKKIMRRMLRWYINPLVDQQNTFNRAIVEALAEVAMGLQEDTEQLAWRTEQASGAVLDRLRRLELARPVGEETLTTHASLPSRILDAFLLGLVHRSPEDMAGRVGDYDDLLKPLALRSALTGAPRPLLDIGCGRGDFLAHVGTLGITAYGIDVNEDAVLWAQSSGLDVRAGEGLAHLRGLAPASLAAITAIQLVEHLDVSGIASLFSEAARALEPHGLLIIETINPACVWAMVNAYLLDPSHRTPLHPGLARFVAERAGLVVDEIRYLRPVPAPVRMAEPSGTGGDGDGVTRANTERLNALLYGPQDYALIAHRPEN